MVLKRIVIKNYKHLDLDMKLVPNKNGFKDSDNYFNYLGNVPKIIGIAGSNAVGKTSFIEVFNIISKYKLSPLNVDIVSNQMLEDEKIKQKVLSENKGVVNITNVTDEKFMMQKKFIDYFFKNIIKIKDDEIFNNAYWKAIDNFFLLKYKEFANDFSKDMEFNFEIIDETIKETLFINFTINNHSGLNIVLDSNSKDKNYINNNGKKTLEKFINSIRFLPTTLNDINSKFPNWYRLFINKERIIEEIIKRNINNDIFVSILKEVDPEIEDIYMDKNKILIKIANKDLDWRRLSSGTIKMIEFFGSIQNQSKQTSILFVDEIENHLNNKVINFIKKAIFGSNRTQLFFTSHSGRALSSLMDNKQIFILEKNINDLEKNTIATIAWKFSSRFNNNNSFESIHKNGNMTPFGNTSKILNILNKIIDNEVNS